MNEFDLSFPALTEKELAPYNIDRYDDTDSGTLPARETANAQLRKVIQWLEANGAFDIQNQRVHEMIHQELVRAIEA